MGAAASHPSPTPPWSCSLVETESLTWLFTVTDYSRWARMPPGTALNFGSLELKNQSYSLKVYSAGLDGDSADFVAVFVDEAFNHDHYSDRGPARFYLEILDASRTYTIFDNHTARSEQTPRDHKRGRGYVRFVKRREMEASCCIREDDDSLTIRCTLSLDREVTRPLIMAPLPLEKPAEATVVGSPTVTVGGFSRLRAALQTGECAYTSRFAIGGSSWYFKVYPNGYCDDNKDYAAVFLARGKSGEPVTTAEFRFELDNKHTEEEAEKKVMLMKHTFDRDNPFHTFPYLVTIGDLAYSDDCLVVRCHLCVIKVTKPIHSATPLTVTVPMCEHSDGKAPTGHGVLGETEDKYKSEWDITPLIADMHQR